FTIREVLKKYHPEVVRYFLLSSHYRSPINYSEENLIEAKGGLERFYTALRPFADVQPVALDTLKDSDYYQRFVTAMDDDFNTREALAAMYDLVRDINTQAKTDDVRARQLVAELKAMAGIFGILDADPEAFLQGGGEGDLDAEQIEALIVERADAKKNRDFARADQIREDLLAQGVVLEDSREGTTWRRE
ncbi:MAG: cysteine--tRNA ligase, partial [Gammaproteobacteria bacterium]